MKDFIWSILQPCLLISSQLLTSPSNFPIIGNAPRWMPLARSVSKDEARANRDAQAALRKECNRLRDIGTWNEQGVREYSDVVAELNGQTAHFGRLFAILVEKNSELPLGHKDRKYKGRV
eukprot:7180153-Pyramimonas_sp.AAC.1